MIQEGILENPPIRAIFGLHVWPENLGQVYFSPGPIMASSDWFHIVIEGKSSHGARPHEGIDAIALSSQVIVNLQSIVSRAVDPTDPAVVTIGKIEGGTKANIIAEKVTIEGTIRTLSETNRNKIPRLIEDVVRGVRAIAKALRVPVAQVPRLAGKHGLPVFRNGPTLCIRRIALDAWLATFRDN